MDLEHWREVQLWIMEGWFMLDEARECYGLVYQEPDPTDFEEDMP